MTISQRGPTIARVVFGLGFLVFGLNGFLRFLPQQPMPDRAGAFVMALLATGYMLPLVKAVEVVAAVMLLSNRFVPLALALLAPNVVNILLFHAVLAPSGIVVALVVLALELYLAWGYREAYRPMLMARAETQPGSKRSVPASSAHAPASTGAGS